MSLTVVGQKVELRSEIEIHAPASIVWDVLTNFRAYPEWNPFIVEADGQLGLGSTVNVTINFPGNRERRLRRCIVKLSPASELRWSSTSILRALVHSEQFFRLRPVTEDRVRLAVGENFSGIMAPRNPAELSQISQGLTMMNQAIKRRAESLRT
jgi:hypothetical protein